MSEIQLDGRLVCRDEIEARTVTELLPEHLLLTRAEPGCLAFDVTPTEHPFVWQVEERFADEEVFAAHQRRAAASSWGRATAGIERRYTVKRLPG